MLRKWGAAVAITAVVASSSSVACAADKTQKQTKTQRQTRPQTQQGALASGNAAGVHEAQSFAGGNTLLWVVGAGVVIGGVALAASGSGNGSTTSTAP